MKIIRKLGSGSGTADTGNVIETVTQTGHGFSVHNVVRMSAPGTYVLAQADIATNSQALGIVAEIVDVNTFKLVSFGQVSGFVGLVIGEIYFLSDVTAGAFQLAEPDISKPLLVATSATTAIMILERGLEGIGGVADVPALSEIYTADSAILAGNMVVSESSGNIIHGDSSIISHAYRVLGLSKVGIPITSSDSILYVGRYTDATWTWTAGDPIYLGQSGVITQTPPTLGGGDVFSIIIGHAVTTTSIMLRIQEPIIL